MLLLRFTVFIYLLGLSNQQKTKLLSPKEVLSRKKRYLIFPTGSNLVITLSLVKALMQVQPRGFMALGECDVPFALPSDTRLFKKHRNVRALQKEEIFQQLDSALSQSGLNGNACVKRIICEAQQLTFPKGASLVADLLRTVFSLDEEYADSNYQGACHESLADDCDIPLLSFILETFLNSANR